MPIYRGDHDIVEASHPTEGPEEGHEARGVTSLDERSASIHRVPPVVADVTEQLRELSQCQHETVEALVDLCGHGYSLPREGSEPALWDAL